MIDDMPTVAGLIAVTSRLKDLPTDFQSPEQAVLFKKVFRACPELPLHSLKGESELAPARAYKPETNNVENPELYAVWPFRVVCLQRPRFLREALAAYNHRLFHQDVGWGYDGNAAALLGMTEEAARILQVKCANSNSAYRWPATWGPNFDWLPDQNHGGNLLETTDLMLLQGESFERGGKILLLPAWPKQWDVSFKLHAPGNTTVRCVAGGGEIKELIVEPATRAKDVVLSAGWIRKG